MPQGVTVYPQCWGWGEQRDTGRPISLQTGVRRRPLWIRSASWRDRVHPTTGPHSWDQGGGGPVDSLLRLC